MKRVLSVLWGEASAARVPEYETWTKAQLIERIQLLEQGNQKNPEKSVSSNNQERQGQGQEQTQTQGNKKRKTFDFSKHPKRFIAIRFAYLGWNYNGLAFQYEPTPLPTVEEEILKALAKSKLINEPEPNCCQFSRCGRTDKGVSAMNQVISLNVRSNLSEDEQKLSNLDDKELPYMSILNSLLPADIRVTSICLRPPPEFDARFSCKYRHYRYLIHKDGLDIDLMNEAASRYIGLHDFRNFCKLDGSKQITNYMRRVYDAKIIPYNDEFVIFDLKGTAFLWHQVRCMVAILLSIGQKLENASLIDDLMDIEKYPCRPNYEMANDIPLILYDCVFDEMEWIYPRDIKPSFNKYIKEFYKLNGVVMDHELKSHVGNIMKEIVMKDKDQIEIVGGTMNLGDGRGRNFRNYVPILKREYAEPYDVVNERYKQKKLQKEKLARESLDI